MEQKELIRFYAFLDNKGYLLKKHRNGISLIKSIKDFNKNNNHEN